MNLNITPANTSEKHVVENLLQYYLHDFSEFTTIAMDESGRFEYPYLAHYWREPDRWPLLIRQNEDIIGLALVRQDADPADGRPYREIAEFFILRSHRRKGLGGAAAKLIFERFSGTWQVAVLHSNNKAQSFWQTVITTHVGRLYQRFNEPMAVILRFEQPFTVARGNESLRVSPHAPCSSRP
jgi:predicted acetyltransferase